LTLDNQNISCAVDLSEEEEEEEEDLDDRQKRLEDGYNQEDETGCELT
jgi:hypothetical protein